MAGGGYWVRRISSSISLIFSLTPMVEYYSRVGAEWGGFCCVCKGGVSDLVVVMLRARGSRGCGARGWTETAKQPLRHQMGSQE